MSNKNVKIDISFKEKYLKYKSKYFNLKNLIQKGGSLFENDTIIDNLIATTADNIRENIKEKTQRLLEVQKERLNLQTLDDTIHKIGEGQFGKVYNLSPNYVLKKIAKVQNKVDKTNDIINEIRMGYYVEHLNRTIPLYSGNLAHSSDDQHFFIIMKKFKDLKDLETSKKPNSSDIDIAISFISQLFLLTNYLKNFSISHGDEKFDNLLFENTSANEENFTFNLSGNQYNIMNCGFKLRLIDWGEASTGISVYGPLWNSAWLEGINKGIRGIKKDTLFNKSAPYTVYLEKICKIIGLLELNKEGEELNVLIPQINPAKIEEMKYNILINDGVASSNPDKILQNIGKTNISNIFRTFKKLYDSKDDQFLTFDEKVNFNAIDFSLLPRFRWVNQYSTDPIKIEFCELPESVAKTLKYSELDASKIKSIYKKIGSNGTDDPATCPYFNRFVSGSSQMFYVDKAYQESPHIEKDLYDSHIKTKINRLIGPSEFIKRFDINADNYYCSLIKTKYFLVLLFNKKNNTDPQNRGYQIMILPFVEELNENLDISADTLIKYNPLGNLIVSTNDNIKQIFYFIKNTVKPNNVTIFPLGFFHFHLNYNPTLNKFFGVCHIKFEISHELGYEHMDPFGYLKKRVQYNENKATLVDLTTGTKNENILEHNYIFSISNNDNLNLYKINCDLPSVKINDESFNILGEVKVGISDNFFNTLTFANINYYNDPVIGSTKDYVLISKITPRQEDINKSGGNQDFFTKNVPFTCRPLITTVAAPVAPRKQYEDETNGLAEMGFGDDVISRYIQLRNQGISHNMAFERILSY